MTRPVARFVLAIHASILAIGLSIPATAAEPKATVAVDAELRRMTQQLLDAIAPGEASVWQGHLHDRFVHVDENAVVRNKQDARPAAATAGSASVEDTIKALDTEYQRAVLRRDLETMDGILADDFVPVTGKGATYSKAQVMD